MIASLPLAIDIAMPNAIFNTFHIRLVLKEDPGLIARFNVGENRREDGSRAMVS